MTAQPTDLSPILARLNRLERENRQWKLGSFALMLAAGTALLMGSQDKPKEKDTAISTDRFGLRDAQGKERMRIGMGPEGPAMMFFDENGTEQGSFFAAKQGTVLRFVDPRGQLISGISLERSGVSLVNIDNNGRLQSGPNALKPDAGLLGPNRRP
jgi:hypothetical protein